MNKIIFNYLLKNFLKTFFVFVLVFYCFGVILNLFEEIEFFKNIDVNIFTPFILTSVFIPSMIIKILPFIIFLSSMWFMIKIRNNKDLLTLKVFGYSNFKILMTLAITSFFLGCLILFFINPITSSMSKYYEKTKSGFSKDIDHLITFNRNGLWIKEKLKLKQRIISASKPDGFELIDVKIFHIDKNSNLIEIIDSKKANIKNNLWILENVVIFKPIDGILIKKEFLNYEITSIYNYEKINNLFKNFDTMPFFLFLMTGLASILSMNTLKRSDNSKHIVIGLLIAVLIFYFKDLSLALGQTNRIPLILSVWAPVIALSFFTLIGVLQINEK